MSGRVNPALARKGWIKAISISKTKGTKKGNVSKAILKEDYGIVGDAHSGSERQVSLLAEESIKKMKDKGLKVGPGDFAENITTEGIGLWNIGIGEKLRLGRNVILEVTHKGKVCHNRCNIYYEVGDCVMPREGIFAKVLKGGEIKVGDEISPLTPFSPQRGGEGAILPHKD